MEISEQRIADQRRAIVTKNLLSNPRLEEIRAQMANTLQATNGDTEEEVTQHINENEQKEENHCLETPKKTHRMRKTQN
jgi:hypothetical protein